jgi:hypothetical protein
VVYPKIYVGITLTNQNDDGAYEIGTIGKLIGNTAASKLLKEN